MPNCELQISKSSFLWLIAFLSRIIFMKQLSRIENSKGANSSPDEDGIRGVIAGSKVDIWV
jgi:hypothetical protein